ncbi:MAG: transposase [Nitrososphaera sp.]|nr:transposase [Nitrososphaera sp.]
MLPIVDIPLVVKKFCSHFAGVFKRPEQQMNFEALVTALTVSENKTVAGMQQQFLNGPTYESLHHFMSNSPWSVENLREMRLRYVVAKLLDAIKLPDPLASSPLAIGTIRRLENTIEELSNDRFLPMVRESEGKWCAAEQEHQLLQCLSQLPKNKFGFRLIAAIDATFIHHAGERIYGVYWYWDYAQRRYVLAQRLVLSSLITVQKQIPLGWKLYHRGFLDEQKAYLEATEPAADACEEDWDEYNALVEKYEQNVKEHKTQNALAAELIDDLEGLPIDAYVFDAALAVPELIDRLGERPWVSRLAKNRHVQTAKGGFEKIESFAKSLDKVAFKPISVETRHGEKRTYWCFSKVMMVRGWKRLRIVISYDNENLEGEPIYLLTNQKQWVQPQKVVQVYMMRDPVEHLIRDGKQELGLEGSQQRNEDGVRKHWELSFTAHTFLEFGLEVPNLPGVPAARLETIGQKSRVMEGVILQGYTNLVKQWVLEGRDTKELVWQVMTQRLNRLAT